MELAHTKTVEEVLAEFKVTEEEGLDSACVEELRKKHGLNGKLTQATTCLVILSFSPL